MANRTRKIFARQDADSRVPRYLQVASVLRRRIKDGLWAVGEKMATLEELEREFGVARVTVRQAIDLLQGEGLVQSFQGRGTFVTKAPGTERWLQLATDWESLISPIRENVPQFLPVATPPEPRLDEGDGIAAAAYKYLCSLQRRRSEPYALARVHIAQHLYDRAPKRFSSRVALVVLAELDGIEISRAHQTLTIGAADVETARHLGIALNAPTAEARCVVTNADGIALYVGEITYRGDCVRLNIELIGKDRE
jgi:GntR family transcriptional regulator